MAEGWEITEQELTELLTVIKKIYDYDFLGYGTASLLRRVNRFADQKNIRTFGQLQNEVLNTEREFELFLQEITVNVTDLFRDPSFFKSLREKVVPALRTYPYIRIWDAGCSTGEETYSLAMIMKEEKAYDRCRIYATDINQKVLSRAREGIYHLRQMKDYTGNYFKAGGRHSLSDYYLVDHGSVHFDESLKKNIVFAVHNLATDASFNEFNLIVCRNVLIYFKRELQERVIGLFHESLVMFGYLALGTKESLPEKFREKFEVIDSKERIYRKVRE